MNYADNFATYYALIDEINYSGPETLSVLEKLVEGIKSFLELMPPKDEQFNKSVAFCVEQFRIDLKLVSNARKRKSDEGKRDGFYEAKKEVKTDLMHTESRLKFIGY